MKRRSWGLAVATLIGVMPLAACAPDVPTALFLGDSYTAGVSLPADDLADRWATRLSAQLGWVELNRGCAGSGYTLPGQACMTTYREQIDALIDADPDVIVVSGAVNDVGATPGEIEAAAQATFLTLKTTFPHARVYAVGGVYAGGEPAVGEPATDGTSVQQINTIIATQAAAAGATFVNIGEPLMDRPDLLSEDGVHPNSAGHAVIATLTSNVISSIE